MLEHVISLDLRRELSSEFLSSACLLEGLRRTRTADGGCAWCRVECQVRRTCRVPTAAVSGASFDRSDGVVSTRQNRARLTRTQPRMLRSWAEPAKPQTWPNSGGGASVVLPSPQILAARLSSRSDTISPPSMRADRSVSAAAPRKRPWRDGAVSSAAKKRQMRASRRLRRQRKDPSAREKRCHRCNVLGIDCVVWDGDRKRKT